MYLGTLEDAEAFAYKVGEGEGRQGGRGAKMQGGDAACQADGHAACAHPPPATRPLLPILAPQVAAGYRLPISEELPECLRQLVRECMAASPDDRPR